MNAEQFHDALSSLPSDLIAETDALRSAPRVNGIAWRKWAALAACLVLVASSALVVLRSGMGGNTKDTAMECAPQAPAAMYSEEKSENLRADEAPAMAMPEAEEALSDNAPADANTQITGDLTPTGYPADGGYFIDLNAAQSVLTYPVREGTLCIDSSQAALLRTSDDLENYLRDWGEYYNLYTLEDACAAFDESWFESFDLLLIRVDTEKSELLPVVDSVTLTGPDSCEIVICGPLLPEDNSPDPAYWHILLPVQKGLLPEGIDITLLFP